MKKMIFMLIILIAQNVQCQQVLRDIETRIMDKTGKKALFTPDGHSNFFSWVSQISLTAQEKDKKANLNLDYKNKKNLTQFHFGASQTLSEGSTEVTPFNLDGISNGTSVTLGFSHLFWKPKMTLDQLKNFEDIRQKHYTTLQKEVDLLITKDSLYKLFDESEKNELIKSNVISHPLSLSLLYKIEKNSFEFITDSLASITRKESKVLHKLIGSLTYFIKTVGKTQQLLNFSASISSNYNPGDKISLVIPFGTTRNYSAKDYTFGSPIKKTDETLAFEYRIVSNNDNSENTLASGFGIDYSITKNLLAFQLPIYFIKGKDKNDKITGLQGGIRLGYLTSTKSGRLSNFKDGFSAEVVITEPFDIFSK